MTPKMAVTITDAPSKAVFSAAQTVGQGREIAYGRRKPSIKDYGDVIVALLCLTAMAGTIYIAELDGNFATAMRLTATIRRVLHLPRPSAKAVDTRQTILVVENENGQRLVAKTALERYGYDVALADNGKQALTMLRHSGGRVALVLLDVGGAGAQVMQQLKGVRPSVPILVSEAAGEKLQAGAAGRVDRPFSAVPLAEAVQHTLGPRPL